MNIPFRSKELSWLSFNARVLQEAADPTVPLLERIKFLGIYSSNLDEFFRVRIATLRRLTTLGSQWTEFNIPDPNETLRKATKIVAQQAQQFNEVYAQITEGLHGHGIQIINETEVPKDQEEWVKDYFRAEVSPHVMPLMLKASSHLPRLRDMPMYLAVRLSRKNGTGRAAQALLEIPNELPRFVVLPKGSDDIQRVMYLDDIIRFGLSDIFGYLPYDQYESYAVKFTRDSELEFDDDFTESVYDKVTEGLKARETGMPVRANYDATIPAPFLRMLLRKLNLSTSESLYPGARYHNRKDLIGFPKLGGPELRNPKPDPVRHKHLRKRERTGYFATMKKRDILVHIPYHPFRHFIELLREASIDPLVQTIQITQYRLAKDSCVAKALVSAARNGKHVTVLVEPQARFDEKANIKWANHYQDAGVHVILGVPGLKVHSKLLLITRREHGKDRRYVAIGTGNFNEDSADIFADHLLLTANPEFGDDAKAIFDFFNRTYRRPKLKHLLAAPFDLRRFFAERVAREIAAASVGKPAAIDLKINNLSDVETIELLYTAARAGVKIRINARGMFSLMTDAVTEKDGGVPIEAIGIVDKYLEHSRMFIFHNGGKPEIFLSSADLLPRNFDTRVETVFPILDNRHRKELITYFELQWADNVKARILDPDQTNTYRKRAEGEEIVRSQEAIEAFLRDQ